MKATPSLTPPASDAAQQPQTTKSVQYHIDDEIASLAREVKLRQVNYPKWVASGRLKQADADYEIAVMQSALNRLKSMRYLFNLCAPVL